MNLTSENIDNRLLLARCCYADYAINYLAKKNIGDNEQASCYLSKMKQLYYSMQALNQFVPAAELAPLVSIPITFAPSFTGTRQLFVDSEAISPAISFSAASSGQQAIAVMAQTNLYQSEYIASISGGDFIITSVLSGTTNNGALVSLATNGVLSGAIALAGGASQWCLNDTQAKKILENIDSLCGCPCGECDDLLDDTLPKYITN